jgi:hypothetical protein
MSILYLLFGAALLILGRKYTWIFTAGITYFITLEIINWIHVDLPYLLVIFVALVLAASSALLASALRRVVVLVMVFLPSSYLFSLLAVAFKWLSGQVLLTYLVGGVLGLVLWAAFPDFTLILLSSLVGALMVAARGVTLSPAWTVGAFLAAALAGVIIQGLILTIEKPERPPLKEEKAEEEAGVNSMRTP